MLTKKLLIVMSFFFFCHGLAAAAIAGSYGTPNVYLGDKDSSNTMGNDGIEFDHSPMTVSSGLASASSRNTDSEVVEFDYSPREDSKIIATRPSMNTDSKDIQFDYSQRPVNCGTPYC